MKKGAEDSLTDPNRHEIVDWTLQVRLESVLVAYWSPYPEVRAVTFLLTIQLFLLRPLEFI